MLVAFVLAQFTRQIHGLLTRTGKLPCQDYRFEN
jgi:hypothetical protein